jgi:hypothetical protein
MRRLIPLLAVLTAAAATVALALGVASGRAAADNCTQGSTTGTQTCTTHGPQSFELGPGCGQADAFLNDNGVFHITINKAGDSWVTGTMQGTITTVDGLGNTTGTGHAQQWFGNEDNNQNAVNHFTSNGYVNMRDGTRIGFHAAGQFTMNANGVVTVNNTTMTCR